MYIVPKETLKHTENSAYGETRVGGGSGLVKIQMERHDGLELYQWLINFDMGYGPWSVRVYGVARFQRPTRRHKWTEQKQTLPIMTNRQAVTMAIECLPHVLTIRED